MRGVQAVAFDSFQFNSIMEPESDSKVANPPPPK